ncbi:MAG TPA: DNA polymerase III subunit delta [Bacillota bacterium]|nr:DNA polymerase III subunit delta [Bacillota bacterium]HPF42798.1 DNA polymerase III subunit delta [Bacillota bacterium]HPJ85500.1 DNA polymerase III subunit delta [Bacillota bacterium]HPQ62363.1 DNA polymerase III subunit delta [Bacillota bacterium]HRX91844.1 DNA polymerase III subunit delta [Candidatus Izemoplasmatales bacterium]
MAEGIVYLVYGADRFLVRQETEKIIQKHNIDRSDTEYYDLEETLVDSAVENAMTIPFLSEKKAVILTNANFLSIQSTEKSLKQNQKILVRYLLNPNPTTIMIVQVFSERIDMNKQIVKIIHDKYEIVDCRQEEEKDVFVRIKDEFGKNGFSIAPDALQLFVGRVGSDSEMLKNELDKLMSYAFGQTEITIDMVKEVVYKNPEDHIYQLVNAIIASDRMLMLKVYKELLDSNIDPMWILGAIVSKFQEILYTKELIRSGNKFDEIMKYFSASKGRTYYILKNANTISDEKLQYFLNGLQDLDLKIKTGKIDKEIGLELFIQRLYE